ncbi:MAG: hypothetical protein HY721_11920 [Planctomycetes bacterium]|nr:hypothetical protein [Planctomycetota bacterium]
MEERRVPLTLIIGLGGTGQLVARHLKAILMRELSAQDFSEIPFVEILVLDTTEQMSPGGIDGSSAALGADEFSDLGGFNLQSVLAHREEYPEIRWFPRHRYLPGELTLGAGGIRHVGRLCYAIRRDGRLVYGRLCEKIRRLSSPGVEDREFYYFKEVIRPRLRSGLQIHLVASCAGGTGGGMLLPAAYDVRDWAARITGKDPVITGHLLLPEAFALSESRQVNFRRNAFAVLAEANHFYKTGRWEAQYREEKQVVPMIPFNFLYLINSGRQDGSLQIREDLCREMGRFIALMALGKEGESYRAAAINLWESCLSQRDQFGEPMVFCSYGAGYRDLSRGALKDYFNHRIAEFLQEAGATDSEDCAQLIGDFRQAVVDRLEEESSRHVQAALVELSSFHSVMGRKAMVELPEINRDVNQHQDLVSKIRRAAQDAWRADIERALREEWDQYAAQLSKYYGRQGVEPGFLRAFLVELTKSLQELRDLRTTSVEETKTLAAEAQFFEEIRKQQRDDSESIQRVEVWSRADRVVLREHHLKLERQELQSFVRDLQERIDRQETLAAKKDFVQRLNLRASLNGEQPQPRYGGSFYRMSDVPAEVADAMERALKRFAVTLFLGPPTTKLVETCLAVSNEVREAFQEECSAYFGSQGSLMPASVIRQRLSEMESQVQVNWSVEGEQDHVERIRRIGCPKQSEIEPVIEPESDRCSTEGYGQVTLVKVDHGAPLHHLRWLKDYQEDFVRYAFSNQRRRANDEWLSPEWPVANPLPGPEAEAYEYFGLASRLGFVERADDAQYALKGLGGGDEVGLKGRAGAFRAFRSAFVESPREVRERILLELRRRYRNREIPEVLEAWARDAFRLAGAHTEEEKVDSLGGEDARVAWNEASGLDRFLRLGKWGLGEPVAVPREELVE